MKTTRLNFIRLASLGALSIALETASGSKRLLAAAATSAAPASGETLRIAHLCDPQLGFGEPGGYDGDVERLKQEIKKVNELAPDVVVFAGDLVNDIKNKEAVKTFLTLIKDIKPPVILTPGNHDIPDPVTPDALAYYRKEFGKDFSTFEIKGRVIISANTQLFRKAPQEEVDNHEKLLTEALKTAKAKKQPVIMLTHVPPFIKRAKEKDDYFNLPKEKRNALLKLCGEHGVFIWLAGHTHITSRRKHEGITVLNGETTSRNFDKHAHGFRLLTIRPDNSFDWEFQPLK